MCSRLATQTRRLLRDAKTRRLATEFACHWLQIDGFDHLDEKSDRHFPTFVGLRNAMAEESIQFFTDLFQHNGSVLNILDCDYTFLNEPLAKHYGIPGVTGAECRGGQRRTDAGRIARRAGPLQQGVLPARSSCVQGLARRAGGVEARRCDGGICARGLHRSYFDREG